jgi:hypothetical protein
MSLVQESDSETLRFWCRDQLAFIREDLEILAGVDKGEVLGALANQENYILEIENEW